MGYGARFAGAVEEAVARVLIFPESGSPLTAGTRRVLTKGFPFSVVYRSDPEAVLIVAVAHQSRRSRYWRAISVRCVLPCGTLNGNVS
ncbi:MAG: type II toxin-antitoxin system RelE/ParE family toxin [Acidiferrobacter sp.]